MSKLFFDHLVCLEEVNIFIKKTAFSQEEREELWGLVDEIIHHRVLDVVLGHLPHEHHGEFLEMFHKSPHDENLIEYLSGKSKKDIKKIIKDEMKKLEKEILVEFVGNG